MLLESEKDGTGSKRLARACAFLEAAAFLDDWGDQASNKTTSHELHAAAKKVREMAVAERRARDRELGK